MKNILIIGVVAFVLAFMVLAPSMTQRNHGVFAWLAVVIAAGIVSLLITLWAWIFYYYHKMFTSRKEAKEEVVEPTNETAKAFLALQKEEDDGKLYFVKHIFLGSYIPDTQEKKNMREQLTYIITRPLNMGDGHLIATDFSKLEQISLEDLVDKNIAKERFLFKKKDAGFIMLNPAMHSYSEYIENQPGHDPIFDAMELKKRLIPEREAVAKAKEDFAKEVEEFRKKFKPVDTYEMKQGKSYLIKVCDDAPETLSYPRNSTIIDFIDDAKILREIKSGTNDITWLFSKSKTLEIVNDMSFFQIFEFME